MTIGGSIALIVLGAILAFAVEFDLAGLSISTIGFILMIGGLVGLLFGLFFADRGGAVVERRAVRRAPVTERVVEEREVY
jgi:NAD/NADP transhydrogenase alpha subunit